jgi:hypothetical protein
MKKGEIIGLTVTVLAVVGGIAVFNMLRKPSKSGGGYLNATGVSGNCGRRLPNGSFEYYTEVLGNDCRRGFKRVQFFGDREGL